MTQDPNRAEEQAQRDRVPGFDVVLEAVVVHLPCREEVDGEEVDPSRGDSHLAREHPHDARQLRKPVLACEHGAQGVRRPRQVEQVGVEEAERNVGGAALHGAFGLRARAGR